jgi:hypothetical protein
MHAYDLFWMTSKRPAVRKEPDWQCVYRSRLVWRVLIGVLSLCVTLFFAMVSAAVLYGAYDFASKLVHGVPVGELWAMPLALIFGGILARSMIRDGYAQIADWLSTPTDYQGTVECCYSAMGVRARRHYVASGPWTWMVSGDLKHDLREGTTFKARFHRRTCELLEVYVRR